MIDYLTQQLKNNSINYNGMQIDRLIRYHDLIYETNKTMNLTSISSGNDAIDKHFIDSLQGLRVCNMHNKSIVDIGTGAGFPGIPLAIFVNDAEFLLVDSLQKRIKFIEHIIDVLNLNNVKCLHFRAEELGRNKLYREHFDIAVSRAVSSLSVLSEYLLPLIKIDGLALAYKGKIQKSELDESAQAMKVLGHAKYKLIDTSISGTDYTRTIVAIQKFNSTPKIYPRKNHLILNKPIS